jgi:hypothetical protein
MKDLQKQVFGFLSRLESACIADVRKQLGDGRASAVCGVLAEFLSLVQTESGTRLTPERADRLARNAGRIRDVVAC